MDDFGYKDIERKETQLRMEILADALERYILMSTIFFRRLNHQEKIDALTELAEIFKEERDEN